MQDHQNLKAFELADALVLAVYAATRRFPREETFGLTAQLRRAIVSAAANIAEGCGRDGLKEYLNFLNIAHGSLREAGYYLDLAGRLGYLRDDLARVLREQHEEAAKALYGLIASLRRKSASLRNPVT